MSSSDKALVVIVAAALGLAGAAYLNWRDRRLIEVARSIDPCDEEAAVRRKTAPLGAPAREDRQPQTRVLSWHRNGKVLTVALVTPRSGRLVVGSVRVVVDRLDDAPAVLYEDADGLHRCR